MPGVPQRLVFRRRRSFTGGLQNFDVSTQRLRRKSMNVETLVAVVVSALVEVWLFLRMVVVFVVVVGTNGCLVVKGFARKEHTGQCSKQLIEADFSGMSL